MIYDPKLLLVLLLFSLLDKAHTDHQPRVTGRGTEPAGTARDSRDTVCKRLLIELSSKLYFAQETSNFYPYISSDCGTWILVRVLPL